MIPATLCKMNPALVELVAALVVQVLLTTNEPLRREVNHFWIVLTLSISTNYYAGIKRKRKEEYLPSEILTMLGKLDEQADRKMEEKERKRMMLQAELEEKRRKPERKQEERMNTMMFGLMQQMMHFFQLGYRNAGSFPPPSFPPMGSSPPFCDDYDMITTTFEHNITSK